MFIKRFMDKCQAKPRIRYPIAITIDEKLIEESEITIHSTSNTEKETRYCINRNYWGKGIFPRVC
jgi:RimJ/RimL family protein N-acetyltransferase